MAAKKNPTKRPPSDSGKPGDIRKSPEGMKPSPSDLAKGKEMRKNAGETFKGPYSPTQPKGASFKERSKSSPGEKKVAPKQAPSPKKPEPKKPSPSTTVPKSVKKKK